MSKFTLDTIVTQFIRPSRGAKLFWQTAEDKCPHHMCQNSWIPAGTAYCKEQGLPLKISPPLTMTQHGVGASRNLNEAGERSTGTEQLDCSVVVLNTNASGHNRPSLIPADSQHEPSRLHFPKVCWDFSFSFGFFQTCCTSLSTNTTDRHRSSSASVQNVIAIFHITTQARHPHWLEAMVPPKLRLQLH